MPKEHAGGVSNAGLRKIPAEWSDDKRSAIQIEFFDYEALDSLDDLVREELALKGTVKHLFKKLVGFEVAKAKTEAAVGVLSHIIHEEDSGLAASALSFACGMMLLAEKTMTEVAAEYGITKQDFQQIVDRKCEELGLRKTRTMRDEEDRQHMSFANFRPGERP